MLAAKHAPGRFNVDYVCGMNVSSARTGIITSNFNLNEVYYNNESVTNQK